VTSAKAATAAKAGRFFTVGVAALLTRSAPVIFFLIVAAAIVIKVVVKAHLILPQQGPLPADKHPRSSRNPQHVWGCAHAHASDLSSRPHASGSVRRYA